MIVIGIGSNSRATFADIAAAICAMEASLGYGEPDAGLCPIASMRRGDAWTPLIGRIEAALDQACRSERNPNRLRWYSQAELMERNLDCASLSVATLKAYGVASVAEAAALVGAGPGSRLVIPRVVYNNVTAAAARVATLESKE